MSWTFVLGNGVVVAGVFVWSGVWGSVVRRTRRLVLG